MKELTLLNNFVFMLQNAVVRVVQQRAERNYLCTAGVLMYEGSGGGGVKMTLGPNEIMGPGRNEVARLAGKYYIQFILILPE